MPQGDGMTSPLRFTARNTGPNPIECAKAELLALTTLADGKVLEEERVAAEAILNCGEKCGHASTCAVYASRLEDDSDDADLSQIVTTLACLRIEEKLGLIEAMWRVACADDELHVNEISLIYSVIDAFAVAGGDAKAA